jgi:hypothetical protein
MGATVEIGNSSTSRVYIKDQPVGIYGLFRYTASFTPGSEGGGGGEVPITQWVPETPVSPFPTVALGVVTVNQGGLYMINYDLSMLRGQVAFVLHTRSAVETRLFYTSMVINDLVHYMFFESNRDGNIGNRATANGLCATEAGVLGLTCTDEIAILCYSGADEVRDFTTIYGFSGDRRVYYPNDVLSGNGWNEMVEQGVLVNDIESDGHTQNFLWTGCDAVGVSVAADCSDWTSTAGSGNRGDRRVITNAWLDTTATSSCSNNRVLECLCTNSPPPVDFNVGYSGGGVYELEDGDTLELVVHANDGASGATACDSGFPTTKNNCHLSLYLVAGAHIP